MIFQWGCPTMQEKLTMTDRTSSVKQGMCPSFLQSPSCVFFVFVLQVLMVSCASLTDLLLGLAVLLPPIC